MLYLTVTATLIAAALQRDQLLIYLDDQGRPQPVTTPAQWALRRQAIFAGMQEAMGPHPGDDKRVPLDVQVTEEVALEQVSRRRITFAVEAGDRVPAYLFLPKSAGKHAAMLCLHQTTQIGKSEPAGLGGSANLHYALELAERGFVTLAPDYPNYGDYQADAYALGYVSATMKGIWNHQRALDLLQSLPEVDPERIGCIGHSLGGHNTLYLAAFDERVKTAVTSCGFNAFPKYMAGDLTGWSHKGYMPRIAERYHCKPAEMPFDFPEVLAAIAPRRIFINAPLHDSNFEVSGVDDCVAAAGPVFALLGAADHLTAIHPDCEHDFPPAAREAAYQAIADALR